MFYKERHICIVLHLFGKKIICTFVSWICILNNLQYLNEIPQNMAKRDHNNLLYTFKLIGNKASQQKTKIPQLTILIPYTNPFQILTTLTIRKCIKLYNLNLSHYNSYVVLNEDKKQSIVIFSDTFYTFESTSTRPPF